MLNIDGSSGEGGGQILRTSLTLSMITGKAFRITGIRAGRKKPGLMRQHLTGVLAAARIGCADVQGAEIGSQDLTFIPGSLAPGEYHFAVGTAGSTMLVLQAILPPLLTASRPSRLVLEGGTHALSAPPFDFIERAFLPLINRMGPRVEAHLERFGFFPAGGGRIVVTIAPIQTLSPLHIHERGEIVSRCATALLSQLPGHIAERELEVVRQRLGWEQADCRIRSAGSLRTSPRTSESHPKTAAAESRPAGPGNAVLLEIQSEHVTELFTALGQVGRSAEAVADDAVSEARAYLASGAPVGPYLADQLLLPMALAGSGSFVTAPPTRHTSTNAEVIQQFLKIPIRIDREESRATVQVG